MKELSEIIKLYNLKFCAVQEGEWSHIILAYPYSPYNSLGDGYAFVDAYYVASNALYNIAKQVKADILAQGYEAQDIHLSLKPLGERGGLGKMLNNRLLTNSEYGSKMTLQAISVKAEFELILSEQPLNYCDSCSLCDKACPTGALCKGVFDRDKCLRNIQDFLEMHSPFMGNRVIGCEDCQKVCPHNAKIKQIDMPQELKNLLSYDSLHGMLSGGKSGYACLAKYIGANYARAKYIKRILYLR